MDFFEYGSIFWKRRKVFFGVIGISFFVAIVFLATQRESYSATLLLNISRSGSQVTTEYSYDGFYRLQADERFADTVVRWIGSPRVAEDILRDAGVDTEKWRVKDLATAFQAGRLSSQVIRVEYSGKEKERLEKLAYSMENILNQYADELNRNAKDPAWFRVVGGEPVIRDAKYTRESALFLAGLLGVFFGFWATLLVHAFEERKKKD